MAQVAAISLTAWLTLTADEEMMYSCLKKVLEVEKAYSSVKYVSETNKPTS